MPFDVLRDGPVLAALSRRERVVPGAREGVTARAVRRRGCGSDRATACGKCHPPGSNRRCATFIATRTSPTSSLQVRSCGDEPALERGRRWFGACSPVRCRSSDTSTRCSPCSEHVDNFETDLNPHGFPRSAW